MDHIPQILRAGSHMASHGSKLESARDVILHCKNGGQIAQMRSRNIRIYELHIQFSH